MQKHRNSFFSKKKNFRQPATEIIKIFGQKKGVKLKIISFLKDQKTGYLPMHLSQF